MHKFYNALKNIKIFKGIQIKSYLKCVRVQCQNFGEPNIRHQLKCILMDQSLIILLYTCTCALLHYSIVLSYFETRHQIGETTSKWRHKIWKTCHTVETSTFIIELIYMYNRKKGRSNCIDLLMHCQYVLVW